MSFKLSLQIGHFDLTTYDVVRPLEAAFVQQCIVQAGGQLPEEVWSADELQRWQKSMDERQIWRLGFLGPEAVTFTRYGFVWLAIGYGPNPAVLSFLRMLAAEGCTIIDPDGPNTERVLETLAATEALHAARNKV